MVGDGFYGEMDMSGFKVGDFVRCDMPGKVGYAGVVGREYQVLRRDNEGLLLANVERGAIDNGCDADRFSFVRHGSLGGEVIPVDPHEETLRDRFAMAALTGLCGNCDSTGMWQWTPAAVAQRAYEIASEMMAERERGK